MLFTQISRKVLCISLQNTRSTQLKITFLTLHGLEVLKSIFRIEQTQYRQFWVCLIRDLFHRRTKKGSELNNSYVKNDTLSIINMIKYGQPIKEINLKINTISIFLLNKCRCDQFRLHSDIFRPVNPYCKVMNAELVTQMGIKNLTKNE